ncbi:hypothetical protein FPZ52_11380 [Qingshengfaniella alkalisoli]|uniref:Flagellar protein FlgJ N-terminal domain-containing protein n=2 Tax=Qingshengfaniella alkalisoli TaxID=2599296 RepID=A0A5B8IXG8_9RHOB|nr:rod-binding protein [Qingshengfaniella alkalisoli]QDY70343.1 hypothetical protein FPZ52_11380 [Qingshengfaniella alkalisoli]
MDINSIQTPLSFRHDRLRDTAVDLEATFLSQMLKSAGFGEMSESFGGGAGEEQFASLLRDAHSGAMTEAGGLGLAQHIFESLKEVTDERP